MMLVRSSRRELKRALWEFLCLAAAVFTPVFVFGQSVLLSGTVTDSTSRLPVAQVTVTLLKGAVLQQRITDSLGKYQFNLNPGKYTVRFESVGYRKTERKISLPTGNTKMTIDPVRLVIDVSQLSSVTVTGQKKLFENKLDRVVFNA